jgi:hypothetical protein
LAIHHIQAGDFMELEEPMIRIATDVDPAELMLYRIRGEFLEMPGLRLTLEQAARLWHMDTAVCASVLMTLVADRFLTKTRGGAYVRMDQA